MSETKYFAIPAGHIVLTREEYDDLIEQRIANRSDRIQEEERYLAEVNRLQAIIESRVGEIGLLKKDLEESRAREKDTAYKLFQANESILTLKREIHLLNEELCRTDTIEEVPHAVSEA